MIKGAKGRKKALAALKKVELSGIETKQETVIKEINNLKDEINKMKPKVTSNKATDIELISYRRNKKSLFSKQQKLERLKHKIDKLEKQILNNKFSICWGTLSASFCYAHLFFFDYSLEEISTGFKIKRCA